MITQENIQYTADEIKAMVRTCEKYNKALEMAKKIYNSEFKPDEAAVLAKYLPMLFPELKDSKDERIRKVIYGWIYTQPSEFFDNGFSKEEMLDWVENKDKAYRIYNTPNCGISVNIYNDNEELKESKDKRMKERLCEFLHDNMLYQDTQEITSWLEKQCEQKFSNIPSRETILAIWELGNDWKELTNGSISTEYGTQLEYIQKHWQESSYYNWEEVTNES